jgi:DNA-binding SARP family transcriptional activator
VVAARLRRGNSRAAVLAGMSTRLYLWPRSRFGLSPGGIGMEFRILGPLEVLADDRPITLGGDKQRALLALLLIHANQTLSSERLIDELWERPPASAVKTMQVHISRVRRALGQRAGEDGNGVVLTREHGYELRVASDSVDALRFERLVDAARGELAADRVGRAASLLEEALSLWRGPPLAEFAYERFAELEIARLDELRIGALEELVEAKLALGRHTEVVGELESLIAEQPYRERLRAQLMLALYPLRSAGRGASGLPGCAAQAGGGAWHRAWRAPARAGAGDPRAGSSADHDQRRGRGHEAASAPTETRVRRT